MAANLDTLDRKHHLHPFTDLKAHKRQGGFTATAGEHIYVHTEDGQKIMDGMSGLWCTNLGYSQTRIMDAIKDQVEKLPYYNSFFNCTTDVTILAAEAVCEVLPEGFNHVFFTNSGSEANDTNIRLIHRYFDLLGKPNKKQFVSRTNAYHGSTIAAASLGGMATSRAQFLPLDYVHHAEQPYAFAQGPDVDPEVFGKEAAQSIADKIDELGADNVAAFIGEPIQGAGGVIVPPESYWPEVERICRERDVLIISDEVICGFGRTGNWFGCQTFNFKPDLITFAKAVTNGYQALGGVGVSDAIAEVLTSNGGYFLHGYTYSGHPIACAAAIATLERMEELQIVDQVRSDTAVYWNDRIQSLSDHPIVGEVRSKGMLAGIEIVKRKDTHERLAKNGEATIKCKDEAIKRGLMVRPVGDTIVSSPPLIMNHEEIDQLVERLSEALDATANSYGVNEF